MDAPSLGGMRVVEAHPSAQRTASFEGNAFVAYRVKGDPVNNLSGGYEDYTGWFRNATVYVSQTAGSGNNGGNYLKIELQGRHDSTDPWVTYTFANSGEIKITANASTGYYARVEGPLMPELRIIGTETGTADATFAVHVYLEA
jgi:hypothetical protein